jgi:hypothetical protein
MNDASLEADDFKRFRHITISRETSLLLPAII